MPNALSTIGMVLAGAVTIFAAGETIPGFTIFTQVVAVFVLIGNAVAYRRKRTNPNVDPFLLVQRWTFVGLVAGVLVAVPVELL